MPRYLVEIKLHGRSQCFVYYHSSMDDIRRRLKDYNHNVEYVKIKDISDNNSVKPLKLNFDEK